MTMMMTALVASVCLAQDDLASIREEMARLREENARLAEKVARLEAHAAEDGGWLTEERAQEIRAVVADALADSASRASLAADGATAGWDKSKGFFLASGDGNFSLVIRGDGQFRWNYNARDIGAATAATGSPAETSAGETYGFEWRRARLIFTGNVIDPSWTFDVKFANNRSATSGNTGYLDDAFVQKALDGGYTLRFGQFKVPFLREDQVSASAQLAVERSLVNEVFGVSRSQGVAAGWSGEGLRAEVSFTDALRANATAPTTGAGAAGGVATGQNTGFSQQTTDYAFAGRLELKPAGEWKQFKDMQSFAGDPMGVLVGIGGYIEQVDAVSGTTATPDRVWAATADLSLEFGGASVLVAAVYRDVLLQGAQATRGGGTDDSLEQWGALAQAGWFATDSVELFARYEMGDTDTDRFRIAASALAADAEQDSILTVGANWWPAGAKSKWVKLTADIGYAFDPIVDFNGSGAGWLVDYTAAGGQTNDGQWLLRTQMQFQF
ncbi:MAG: hypothetical protein RL325_1262 [Planctomycetota bacterium]